MRRILLHLAMRWHELASDRAARRAGAYLNLCQRHEEAADALAERLEALDAED